jgi:hypothetical protein
MNGPFSKKKKKEKKPNSKNRPVLLQFVVYKVQSWIRPESTRAGYALSLVILCH